MKILSVWAREILDSRGNPTVEVEAVVENGFGIGVAPSGASTGKHEARELRDGGPRYDGKGVQRAVTNVNTIIAPELIGMDATDQEGIDNKMIKLDGTADKSKLGANAMVATSMALLRAAASALRKPVHEYLDGKTIPRAMFNIVNGGKHAGGKLAVQEFMVMPQATTFNESLKMASEIYHALGKRLSTKYGIGATHVGDEGGYAPPIDNTYKALDEIVAAIDEIGYSSSCPLAMDCAASSFFNKGKYTIDGKELDESELAIYYTDLLKAYPVKSIEDPFDEESFSAFASLTHDLQSMNIQVVGDDLLVTNPKRIQKAIDEKSVTTLLLKVNQIGTVTEAIEASNLARKNGMNVIVSHRSGETEDTFIADFAVGIDAGQIKSGAPARGERTAKYNQLLRIEEWLVAKAAMEEIAP